MKSFQSVLRFHSMFLPSLAIFFLADSQAQAAMMTENFNSSVSAATNGWAGSNNNYASGAGSNYGFIDDGSNESGGAGGEAGGRFSRMGNGGATDLDGYYADLTLGGSFSRTTDFSASGKFDMTSVGSTPNTGFYLGFFNATLGSSEGFVGIAFLDEGTGFKFGPAVRFGDGIEVAGSTTAITLANAFNKNRTFSLSWDADGGATNDGRLTVTLGGVGGNTIFVDIPNTGPFDARNFSLSAFGWSQKELGTPFNLSNNLSMTGYIDDVTYSVVPEPGTAIPFLIGGAVVLAKRRRTD